MEHLPQGVKLRIVVGSGFCFHSQEEFGVFYEKFEENKDNRIARLKVPIRQSCAILDEETVLSGFPGNLDTGLFSKDEVRFCSIHRGDDAVSRRYQGYFKQVWDVGSVLSVQEIPIIYAHEEDPPRTPRLCESKSGASSVATQFCISTPVCLQGNEESLTQKLDNRRSASQTRRSPLSSDQAQSILADALKISWTRKRSCSATPSERNRSRSRPMSPKRNLSKDVEEC